MEYHGIDAARPDLVCSAKDNSRRQGSRDNATGKQRQKETGEAIEETTANGIDTEDRQSQALQSQGQNEW